jgi:hypothetical protein
LLLDLFRKAVEDQAVQRCHRDQRRRSTARHQSAGAAHFSVYREHV